MDARVKLLWHGGVSGLHRGDTIRPDMVGHRCVEGCPVCEAHAKGEDHDLDPATPSGYVYATTNRRYARFHASKCVGGDLYRVRLVGPVEASAEDGPFPTWRASSAAVVKIVERGVILTMKERLDLFRRWGGTKAEFQTMMDDATARFSAYRETRAVA